MARSPAALFNLIAASTLCRTTPDRRDPFAYRRGDGLGPAEMIIDTSALIAILRDEPNARLYANAIAEGAVRRFSAVNYVEIAALIYASRDSIASRRFDDLLRARITIEPVTEAQAHIAREAYRDFDRASGQPD